MNDIFSKIEQAAHAGDYGCNPRPLPSDAKNIAGNYAKGKVPWRGLVFSIEQPRNSYRCGTDANGKQWQSLMRAHYGGILGVRGNDGDLMDVFIGAWPESETVWIINQIDPRTGGFDEHKTLVCFESEEAARNAYMHSYERGWRGLGSMVKCTIGQFKWWLKFGNHKRPVKAEDLPFDDESDEMEKTVAWNAAAEPVGMDMAGLIYSMRTEDAGGLMLDSVTVGDILEDADCEMALDALVVPVAKLERKMQQLQAIMGAASESVEITAMQITPPFKQRGTTNIAAVFELSDGQTVTIYMHNPDTTPNKLAPTDELISWKWLLNKKDVTIVVAPEKGEDLNPREVGRRIMKLAEKNSARFAQANKNRAERLANIESLKAGVQAKEAELSGLTKEIEVLTVKVEEKKASASNAGAVGAKKAIVATGPGPRYSISLLGTGDTESQARIAAYAKTNNGFNQYDEEYKGGQLVSISKDLQDLLDAADSNEYGSDEGGVSSISAPGDSSILLQWALGALYIEGGVLYSKYKLGDKPWEAAKEMNSGGVQEGAAVDPISDLPAGWTESAPGGMATSKDPETGGVVDKQIANGKWFAVANKDGIGTLEGFDTRADAFAALAAAVAKPAESIGDKRNAAFKAVFSALEENHGWEREAPSAGGSWAGKASKMFDGLGPKGAITPNGERRIVIWNARANFLQAQLGDEVIGSEIVAEYAKPEHYAEVAAKINAKVEAYVAEKTGKANKPAEPTAESASDVAARLESFLGKPGNAYMKIKNEAAALSQEMRNAVAMHYGHEPGQFGAADYVIANLVLDVERKRALTPEGYAEIVAGGDDALKNWQDVFDSHFQGRVVETRNALRALGWEADNYSWPMAKGGYSLDAKFKQVGAGSNIVGVTYKVNEGQRITGLFADDLSKTPEQLAAEIDKAAPVSQQSDGEPASPTDAELEAAARAGAEVKRIARNLADPSTKGMVPVAYLTDGKEINIALWTEGDWKRAVSAVEEGEMQSAYTPFDWGQVKMPTAVQLGAKKINESTLKTIVMKREGGEGWTNGNFLDVNAVPNFVQKAITESFGATDVSTVAADRFDRVVQNAKASATTQVEPIASYDQEFADTSSTEAIKKGKKVQVNAFVLANKETGLVVNIDKRYFGYFAKTYKGAEFFASDATSPILVKHRGQVVGVVMPIGSADATTLKRAMKAGETGDKVVVKAGDDTVYQQMEAQREIMKKVDGAYSFAKASTDFKLWLAEETESSVYGKAYQLDQPYSPLATAAAMEEAAKKYGATIEWDFFGGTPA